MNENDDILDQHSPNFIVYDAMMGSGKTTKIMQKIKDSHENQNFLYITPLLDECHRIAGTSYLPDDDYKRPVTVSLSDDYKSIHYLYDEDALLKDRRFKHPSYKGGTKAENLLYLLNNKENIVSTHQLFINLTPDMLEKAKDYILIIDETVQVYEFYVEYTEKELDAMFRLGWIRVDDSDEFTLRFNRESFGDNGGDPTGTKYETFALMCDLGQLLYVDHKLIVWELSIETLSSFKEVWIATYLFEGSQMSSYLKSHKIEYELIQFGSKPSEIKHLINIIEEKRINSIGGEKPSSPNLSATEFKRDKKYVCESLSKSLDNYFRNKVKAKKDDRLWTSFKDARAAIGQSRYRDDWLAFNVKATNNYQHVHNIAYLINLYPNPMLVKVSSKKGFPIREDIFALSEMVQWIWRSAIRNNEPINLFIPSIRMRTLLKLWLNDQFILDKPKEGNAA